MSSAASMLVMESAGDSMGVDSEAFEFTVMNSISHINLDSVEVFLIVKLGTFSTS